MRKVCEDTNLGDSSELRRLLKKNAFLSTAFKDSNRYTQSQHIRNIRTYKVINALYSKNKLKNLCERPVGTQTLST